MIHWGVIGPGGIAVRFATATTSVVDGEIVAVGSRSIDRANAYGERFGVERRYDDVRALVADPNVDAVYVATPASNHEAAAISAIEAGKHVLCEKPLALNAGQAVRMVAAATRAGIFMLEGIWSRYLPSYVTLAEVLATGRIGEPRQVDADFGFQAHFDVTNRATISPPEVSPVLRTPTLRA